MILAISGFIAGTNVALASTAKCGDDKNCKKECCKKGDKKDCKKDDKKACCKKGEKQEDKKGDKKDNSQNQTK